MYVKCFVILNMIKDVVCRVHNKYRLLTVDGDKDTDLSKLYRLAYIASNHSSVLFLLAGIAHNDNGAATSGNTYSFFHPTPMSVAIILIIKSFLMLHSKQFSLRMPKLSNGLRGLIPIRREDPIDHLMSNVSNVWCSIAFCVIFMYNIHGPNKQHMYFVERISPENAMTAVMFAAINVVLPKLIQSCKCFNKGVNKNVVSSNEVSAFYNNMMGKWFFLTLWVMITTTLAGQACMIMKHDGMDTNFEFGWLK